MPETENAERSDDNQVKTSRSPIHVVLGSRLLWSTLTIVVLLVGFNKNLDEWRLWYLVASLVLVSFLFVLLRVEYQTGLVFIRTMFWISLVLVLIVSIGFISTQEVQTVTNTIRSAIPEGVPTPINLGD